MNKTTIMRKPLLTILVLFLAAGGLLRAQTHIDWNILADVDFKKEYSDDIGMSYDLAEFGENVQNLDGQEVIIRGYMIPLDGFGVSYALSQNPNKICFFCGGSGPETVIDLKLKPKFIRRYEMDAIMTFKGKLQLNKDNLNSFTYVLLDAQPL